MRLSRKPGLKRIFKTIRLTGERSAGAYCKVGSTTYSSGIGDVELTLPIGMVITIGINSDTSAIITVNDRMYWEGTGTKELRYVVVTDAHINFGTEASYDLAIRVTEEREKAIRFTFRNEAYLACDGMTWGEWVLGLKYIDHNGNYNTKGFYIGTSSYTVKYYNGYDALDVTTAGGAIVSSEDKIVDGHAYGFNIPE